MNRGIPVGDGRGFEFFGAAWGWTQNAPFRRYKGWTYEGGTCSPLIVRWPGVTTRGAISHLTGHVVDFMPTFLELAGGVVAGRDKSAARPAMEGRSLVPILRGRTPDPHPILLGWELHGSRALLDGAWKLVWVAGKKAWELYDLVHDRTETVDLAARNPKRVETMVAQWKKWAGQTEAPIRCMNAARSTRRQFLLHTAAGGLAFALASRGGAASAAAVSPAVQRDQALVAITLDLEMSRNFPQWEITHWDYRKGDLDDPAKHYTVQACRRVKQRGGVIHCFAVGQVFEQENVDWLKEIVAAGHPVGNHTYDHVRITATRREEIQPRFQRAPWLVGDVSPRQFIENNIRLASEAMQTRLGIAPNGFRTPGGFPNGLADRPDLQRMLLDLGFTWVSSKSRGPAMRAEPQREPPPEFFDSIVAAQRECQPFIYPTGLIEIPFSPISDIAAFRAYRWKLEYFLESIRRSLEWAIENRMVYDFLAHPSCLGVVDPEFRAIDLICDLVEKSRGRAVIVGLDAVARIVAQR